MSQLTLYNAVLRTVTIRIGPTDGRYTDGRTAIVGEAPSRGGLAHRGAVERFHLSSHSALLRLVLPTQPRSGPLRFGSAPASKFLTVRNLISRSPRRS